MLPAQIILLPAQIILLPSQIIRITAQVTLVTYFIKFVLNLPPNLPAFLSLYLSKSALGSAFRTLQL